LGTISAASTPMITSTTINSISVKPRAKRARWERRAGKDCMSVFNVGGLQSVQCHE
jgi:hypothetical protein